MELEKVMSERISVRKFSDKKLSEEVLGKILKAGQIAPTAKNSQPQLVYVATGEKGLDLVKQMSPCNYNPQAVLIVCGDESQCFVNNGRSSCDVDCAIVTTHMMLAAYDNGVDSVWIGMFDAKKVKELLGLAENITPVCLLYLGYRAEGVEANPRHFDTKPLEQLVKFID